MIPILTNKLLKGDFRYERNSTSSTRDYTVGHGHPLKNKRIPFFKFGKQFTEIPILKSEIAD